MTPPSIDLNADCGEDPLALRDGREASLLEAVTSVNVACGGHAGDEASMRETVALAAARGVAVGAHPGYEDRAGFGRVERPVPAAEVERTVAAQVARLGRVAAALGVRLRHVKPHGALYHAAGRREEVAAAIARAAAAWDPDLVLVAAAGSRALDVWRGLGRRVRGEAFADRVYEPDGSLRPRERPDALLASPARAAAQALRIARGEGVVASDGRVLPLDAGTIGVHGDTPGAAALARAVRAALEAAGITVRS